MGMAVTPTAGNASAPPDARPAADSRRLKFNNNSGFHTELKRRVEEYFQRTGARQRDCPEMYVKTGILLAGFAVTYLLLVFAAQTWWQALPLAIVLGLCLAAIGFNIPHDGGHHAYSNRAWVNRIMATVLDVFGASSYIWNQKHAVFHHTYVNITGHDSDIDLGVLGRLTPHQPRFAFHRFQHLYLWPLYGLLAIKWQLFDDFKDVITGRIGEHRFPRPKGRDLAIFIGGKATFFVLAFGIPLMVHSVLTVALFFVIASAVLGIVMSVVFQLAHCVEHAEFPLPSEDTGRMENAWAIHQVETTVNFARHSRIVAWYVGGLNFQIEHHLLPRVCHVNFPALSHLVQQVCREYGVKYAEHPTVRAGIASHFRWLRQMGMPDEQPGSRFTSAA
jgi:linoleoyl-CoA desaturase